MPIQNTKAKIRENAEEIFEVLSTERFHDFYLGIFETDIQAIKETEEEREKLHQKVLEKIEQIFSKVIS